MVTKIFNVSLPAELLKIIDKQAKAMYQNRSEYVKGAIFARLKAENALDENGWRTRTLEELKKEQLRDFLKSYNPSLIRDDLEWG